MRPVVQSELGRWPYQGSVYTIDLLQDDLERLTTKVLSSSLSVFQVMFYNGKFLRLAMVSDGARALVTTLIEVLERLAVSGCLAGARRRTDVLFQRTQLPHAEHDVNWSMNG